MYEVIFVEEMNALIEERFANMYETEGYHLAASVPAQIPWFQCSLECKCFSQQAMSELDKIVCKCIKRKINTPEDISFVLALDLQIVVGEIEELCQTGLIVIDSGIISLTENGEKAFQIQKKVEDRIEIFLVYMNGITGEWVCSDERWIKEEELQDNTLRFQPIKSVIRQDIENNDYIISSLQQINETQIVSAKLQEYKAVVYSEEEVILFKNNTDIIFTMYNQARDELDIKAADSLMRKYKRRELLEVMQAEEYILQNEKVFSDYGMAVKELKYYRNKEIRELFKNIFDIAKESIFIISPWIDNKNYVMTEELLAKIEYALSVRGIQISIGYGYPSEKKMNAKRHKYMQDVTKKKEIGDNDKDWQTELMANKLKTMFAKYDNFSIFYVGTHEKILSYDEQYTLIGSYNFLSYDGGELEQYEGFNFRYEGSVMINDSEFARYVKREIFNIIK